MQITTLQSTSIEQITATFVEAFKDYELPMRLTVEQMRRKISVENINLSYSLGAFDGDEMVGFILHGFGVVDGKKTLWNGGTGVVETARGNRLTEKMYEFITPILKANNTERIILEVLQTNEKAKKVYEKIGFVTQREFFSYKGEMQTDKWTTHIVQQLEEYDLTTLSTFEEVKPCWQSSNPVLRNWGKAIKAIAVKNEKEIIGLLIYNQTNKRIQRFAVNKDFRRQGIATAMFNYATEHFDRQLTVVNMDSSVEGLNAFLLSLGLKRFAEQWEMKRMYPTH